MKKSIFIAIVGLIACIFCSCSSQKFTVKGDPGTIIKNPSGKQLATIDDSGYAAIELLYKDRSPFLLAQSPKTNKDVLFALDYKDEKRSGTIWGIGFTGLTIGLEAGVATVVGLAIESAPLALYSMGPFYLGTIGGGVLFYRAQKGYYKYIYLEEQTTNNDLIKE